MFHVSKKFFAATRELQSGPDTLLSTSDCPAISDPSLARFQMKKSIFIFALLAQIFLIGPASAFNGPATPNLPTVFYTQVNYNTLNAAISSGGNLPGVPNGPSSLPWWGNQAAAEAAAWAWYNSTSWGGGVQTPKVVTVVITGQKTFFTPSFAYASSGNFVQAVSVARLEFPGEPPEVSLSGSTFGTDSVQYYAISQ